jgi:hypothetical protein
MGYLNNFYFDIETTTLYEDLDDLKINDKRGYNLVIKKIDKRKLRTGEKIELHSDYQKAYQEIGPLVPEYGKIVCLSFGYYDFKDDKNIPVINSIYGDIEKDIIIDIQTLFKKINSSQKPLCGYNIRNFDIPFLVKKFYQYELEIPFVLQQWDKKPWESHLVDLKDVWRTAGSEICTLDEVTYMLGLDSPKRVMSGEKVYEFYWMGDLESIKKYCESDVKACMEIAKKIRL